MSQTQTRAKNVSTTRTGNELHELGAPRRYSAQGLAEMAQPDDEPGAGEERFRAVAQIDAVESLDGNTAMDFRDAFIVLYVNADATRAVEVTFVSACTDHEEIPRTRDFEPTHEHVGEMSAQTRERYSPILEHHRAIEQGELR